ncbi:Carbohydrate kinase PfkB domain-containing protein [Caenorhabditis elegans]|uniref:Carbohydrate kinase PfkB domain-containing protein n=1 Tax=Caenorhabditis elegans TaxID=6239 RepID=Q22721_CAEEL|nr:Carbohydrate kinase PfkB domain-containing protein [Caenorhabditis elegans]CCD71506.1 Carbohydrate kinase PfkB domain-containing protein [Caenorhabditis elegans]|eukprot:NP_508405.2 Uncharacterized protein CELE_T24C12.3 [Caenorhabditis elegans]
MCSRFFGQKRSFSKFLQISPQVKEALASGEGVVALESTVITHGLPYPHNLSTARSLEQKVRSSGSHPATIALFDGKIHVGLDDEKLELLASSQNAVKVSSRDIAKTLIKKEVGGTTVASTMKIAHAAGISVFATGGIGGVHRGADQTFDVSADLQELSQTPVCVVCSGVKSILDIPKTVEYLETHSVNCIVYGQENVFPSFFTRTSDRKAQFCTESLEEVVHLLKTSKSLGLPYGTILACPIPEKYAADGDAIQKAIDQAVQEAIEQNIASQSVTPFILARVNELTQGASMATNIALLENNASIAGRLAAKLCDRRPLTISQSQPTASTTRKPKVVSIGATIVDFEAITSEDVKDDGGSYNGQVVQRMGGVARNHADALARLGCDSVFISAIGDDNNGHFFRQNSHKIDINRVKIISNKPTCTYLAVNVKGNVKYGIVTCEPLLSVITPSLVESNEDALESSDFILLDSNLSVPVMARVLEIAKKHDKQVWLEPTDIDKVKKVFDTGLVGAVTAASPNANEFLKWAKLCHVSVDPSVIDTADGVLELIEKEKTKLLLNTSIFIVTLANKGSAVVYRNKLGQLEFQSLPPPLQMNKVVSVSGAGDSFNSGVIAGLAHNKTVVESLQIGQECARLTLQTSLAISDAITPNLLA